MLVDLDGLSKNGVDLSLSRAIVGEGNFSEVRSFIWNLRILSQFVPEIETQSRTVEIKEGDGVPLRALALQTESLVIELDRCPKVTDTERNHTDSWLHRFLP